MTKRTYVQLEKSKLLDQELIARIRRYGICKLARKVDVPHARITQLISCEHGLNEDLAKRIFRIVGWVGY